MLSLPSSVSVMKNRVSLRAHELNPFLGARVLSDSQVEICVWSPTVNQVQVYLEGRENEKPFCLEKQSGGYHVGVMGEAHPGDCYYLSFDGGPKRPDPASRFQPHGVHGPSQIVAHDFVWTDSLWQGVARESLVIYELHIGTFTESGTFRGASERLDELVDLGVTAIELMPLADCPGRWNWGYDGVCLFAPNRNYGTPDDLKFLIDTAHAKGLSVFLDVVYNHFGPEGNYLAESGPYLSPRHTTVWGAAPNFDDPEYGEGLRRFFIANAIHWLDEYHFDGLRVDAIHCMKDESEFHVVADISENVRSWSARARRSVMLIAETNVFDREMQTPISDGGYGFDAQWCDDFLHSVFAVAKPGEQLCHRRYETGADLHQTLRCGYIHEGTLRGDRGRVRGRQPADRQGLVYCIQHHDFVGNHPAGKRLHQVTSTETQQAAAALLLLSPAIPMLFMGEEFCCESPFQFFVDFGDEHLRKAVVEGRKREYPQHDWSMSTLPTDAMAFHDSKVGSVLDGNGRMRAWYQKLLACRKNWVDDGTLTQQTMTVDTDVDLGIFILRYRTGGKCVTVATRLSDGSAKHEVVDFSATGDLILDSCPEQTSTMQLLPNHAKVFLQTFD